MIKVLAQTIAILALAFGLGIWSVHSALETAQRPGSITVGAWTAYPEAGTPAGDPYSKAHIARNGELPLGAGEGLVFTATRDSAGASLSSDCSYVIEGQIPPSRLWTLRGNVSSGPEAKNFLPSLLHSRRVVYRQDGSIRIHVSQQARPGNWLHVPASARPAIVFTFYDTDLSSAARAREVVMPQILKESCDD